MQNLISDFADKVEIITPDDGYHYFFAYYDMRATGEGINQNHLCHRVPFMDRLQAADDVCEVGYLKDKKFCKIGETTAWNFQQGAMLQYHPFKENTVFYNVVAEGRFCTVTHNYATGEKSYTDRATACVSPDGRLGISVNFGRIFAFRPGYGYAGYVDELAGVNAPENDGVFLTDMVSGKSRLLISYKAMCKQAGFTAGDKILVNHVTFNVSSDRYVMLVRNFPEPGKGWSTSMVIGDLYGNIKTVIKRSYVSHYKWLSDRKILAHCTVAGDGDKSCYAIDVDTCKAIKYDSFFFHEDHNPDIHCTLTPDGKYILGDGYPNEGYRDLLAINVQTGESKIVLKAKTVVPSVVDIRCDLHARYVFGGTHISFDTVHNGSRQIAIFPLNEIRF